MTGPVLELVDIRAGYGETQVLNGVGFQVAEGERLAIIGRNGVGKTTTLAAIMGLARLHGGDIRLRGQPIGAMPTHRRARLGLGLVPQTRDIFPSLSVAENLLAGCRNGARLDEAYALFPQLAERARNGGGQLSGGEQQMLSIARTLMADPKVLMLDEPLEGLAPVIRDTLMEAFDTLARERDLTVILVEQHADLALEFADRALILDAGTVVHAGTSADILADPTLLERHVGVGPADRPETGQGASAMTLIEGHTAKPAPTGVPVWDVDPYDPAILSDPTDYYAELRARGPFVYIPKYAILACGRYAETKEVFSDHTRFVSSRGVGLQDFKLDQPWRPPSIVLEVDPPYHTRTRTVIARALSPKAVARLRDGFRDAADALVDALLRQGTFDAVADLAEAFPVQVFSRAVGLKGADRRRLVDYGSMVFNALGPDNALRQAAMAKGADIVPWIMEQCRRENLEPDGFGATIYAAADAGELTEEEAGMLVRSLLSAGIDTTVTGLGSALWCLATNPSEFDRLKAEPALARGAFEETLRFTSPVHSFCRTADLDTEVAGVAIEKDTKILCVLGAANLDDGQWPDASRFDITRRATGHLAFGTGIHGCVGQNVARAEAEAVLGALATKVAAIELAGDAVWRPNNAMRALGRMPVRLRAA